jgi:DNA topoisomerase-3
MQNKRLFIAEKPSLAEAIATSLAAQSGNVVHKRNGGYYVGSNVVIPAAGHLLEQAPPDAYNVIYKKWEVSHLPIAPTAWISITQGDTEEKRKSNERRIAFIADELQKAGEVVHAGDNDREGQLIVDELLHFLDNKKPVLRLTVSDYHPDAVAYELAHLKPNTDPQYKGWSDAALARSRFDWLYGINMTRAYTLAARRVGYLSVLPVGRVQTPTLALVVQRDVTIESFKPVPFFEVVGTFEHPNGSFSARWNMPELQDGLDENGRLLRKDIAETKVQALASESSKVQTYSAQEKKTPPPLLHSLGSLVKSANAAFGYTAAEVLECAQALYEKHKLTTYPRVDSRHMTVQQFSSAPLIFETIAANDTKFLAFETLADWRISSKAVDDTKCAIHHAIIPTATKLDLSLLSEKERHIYDMVARQFVAQFLPHYRYTLTEVSVVAGDDVFTTSGQTMLDRGWKVALDDDDIEESKEASANIPVMQEGDTFMSQAFAIRSRATSPPKRFTDGTLYEAMASVHKFVSNPEIKKRLRDGDGIGTEATKSGIVEELKNRGFLGYDKAGSKSLVSTPAGRSLIRALPPLARDPGLTALCEQSLEDIAAGKLSVDSYLAKQLELVERLVRDAAGAKLNLPAAPSCTQCKTGFLYKRADADKPFWACTNFQSENKCTATYKDDGGKPGSLTAKNATAALVGSAEKLAALRRT